MKTRILLTIAFLASTASSLWAQTTLRSSRLSWPYLWAQYPERSSWRVLIWFSWMKKNLTCPL